MLLSYCGRRRLRPTIAALHISSSPSTSPLQQYQDNSTRHSPYIGVHWHRANKRWIAEVRHQGMRVLYKSFIDEREAALAVDDALRQTFGETILTNFHKATGVFLDPRQAFVVPTDEKAMHDMGGTSNSNRNSNSKSTSKIPSNSANTGVTFVQALSKYKAVIKQHGRPLLLGLFSTKSQALTAIKEKTVPVSKGGMAAAPKQSRFLGLSWDTYHKRWTARLHHEGIRVLSRTFKEEMEEEAARVYDQHARRYHGEEALVNFDHDGVFLDPKNRVSRVVSSNSNSNGNSSSSSSSNTPGDIDYRGLSWSKEMQKWHAQIQVAGHVYNLGYHSNPETAALLYDAAAREHHGARARCNFDEQGMRTNVRIKLNNSAGAMSRYVLRTPVEKERGGGDEVRKRRGGRQGIK